MTSIRARIGRWWTAETGVAALELTLIAPVLMLVAFGTYEVSRVVSAYHVLSSAAGEAVRHAARLPDPCASGGFSSDQETAITRRAERTAAGTTRLAGISAVVMVRCVDREDADLAGRYGNVGDIGVITVEVTARVRPVLGGLFLDADGLVLTSQQEQAWIG